MKGKSFLTGLIFLFCLSSSASAEEITITTYYPAPYGSYNELQLYPHSPAVVTCDDSHRGVMYYDSNENVIKVCRGAAWGWEAPSYWELSGSNLYTSDNAWNVGIGTANPQNKLDVVGAAAIGSGYAGVNTAPANGLLVEGNVGIGTDNPQNKLDVAGAAVIGSSFAGVTTAPSNGLLVWGDVGIETATPLSKLSVGTIGNSNWSISCRGNNGIFAEGMDGVGVSAFSRSGNYGVLASGGAAGVYAMGNTAVVGEGQNTGVFGTGGDYGVFGALGNVAGVCGTSSNVGVYGEGNWTGVYGIGTNQGLLGYSLSPSGYGVFGQGGSAGVYGDSGNYGVRGVGDIGVYAEGNATGVFGSAGGTGVEGRGNTYDFYASGGGVNYGPFTGAHEVKLSKDFPKSIKKGLIVSVTGETQIRKDEKEGISLSSTLPTVKLANQVNDRAVLGVLVSEAPLPKEHWYKAKEGEHFGIVNALGEGRVWVSNINGSIEAGDYITTSDISGYGQKQNDDLLHNYTLGKATENIDWDKVPETIEFNGKPYKVYLIGVIYTSG